MTAGRKEPGGRKPADFNPEIITSRQATNDVCKLLRVACEASRMDWGRFITSVMCRLPRRPLLRRRFSEYNILNPLDPLTAARFLADVTVPAFPESAPDLARTLFLPAINRLFWRPTRFFRQPDEYDDVCSFPREHWFFINGIMTNEEVARYNSACLTHLFHRPLTVVQNATCSGTVDLLECVAGKGLKFCNRRIMTEPAWRATTAILEALNRDEIETVVVVAHSQGTIILSNVLATIEEALKSEFATEENPRWHRFTRNLMGEVKTENLKILRNNLAHALAVFTEDKSVKVMDRLMKLELYTFANCADRMRYVAESEKLPYMEHFANEFDWVARLGILSPVRADGAATIEIDGPVYLQEREWGHLLNEHYLMAIDDHLYPGAGRHSRVENPFPPGGGGPARPRLYDYFHGKSP